MNKVLYISCLRFLLQLLISESIYVLDFPRRDKFPLRLGLGLASTVCAASLWYFLWDRLFTWQGIIQVIYYFGLYGMTLLLMIGCFQASPLQILYAGTGGYATEHLAFSIERLLRYATGFGTSPSNLLVDNLVFRFLIYVLTAALLYLLIVKPNHEEKSLTYQETRQRIIITSMVLMAVAIILSVYCRMPGAVPSEVYFLIYGGAFCWAILQITFGLLRENKMTMDREMMEQLFQISNQQQKNSQETIDIINRKCHDLKHQIRLIQSQSAEWDDYLQEMQEAVSAMGAVYHTGNKALDYILQEKALLFQKYNIVFTCQADGSAIAFMRSPDIYALFGNILDNAWESVLKESEDQRIISLLIRRTGEGMTMIHLENQCSSKVLFDDGLPLTNKEDKIHHGFGVRSVRSIARQYHGEVLMREEGGLFVTDILLVPDLPTR